MGDGEGLSGDGVAVVNGYTRKPEWLRIQMGTTESYRQVKSSLASNRLHTVCEEARCPNLHECWGQHKTATFMILGDTCTRRCRFCAVKTGLPGAVDVGESERVAESVAEMGLSHVVITMVNRDDLRDGGATQMANTVRAIRRRTASRAEGSTTIEVLSSDLMGDERSIAVLCEGKSEIMSHNLETVRRLTPLVRSRSTYERSLSFLALVGKIDPEAIVKSSLMLGLGETKEEILEAMDDLLQVGVKVLNMGQYLQPTVSNIPVQKYWTPAEFLELRQLALEKGFFYCEAGPLVRSSYHAGLQYQSIRRRLDGNREPAVSS
jgi:lipoic acid synthetase